MTLGAIYTLRIADHYKLSNAVNSLVDVIYVLQASGGSVLVSYVDIGIRYLSRRVVDVTAYMRSSIPTSLAATVYKIYSRLIRQTNPSPREETNNRPIDVYI